MTILWRNVPRRYWLWRHDRHGYLDLMGATWYCGCGSFIEPPYPPGSDGTP